MCFFTCLSLEYKLYEVRNVVGLVCYYILSTRYTIGFIVFKWMNEMSLALDCELWALGNHILSLLNPLCPPQGLVFRRQWIKAERMNVGLLRMDECRHIFASIDSYPFLNIVCSLCWASVVPIGGDLVLTLWEFLTCVSSLAHHMKELVSTQSRASAKWTKLLLSYFRPGIPQCSLENQIISLPENFEPHFL